MTRRVTALALGVAIAGTVAAAPAGAAERLTERDARRVAERLARNVAGERNVSAWYVSEAVKVRRTRIVFMYADRNRDHLHCTAKIIIEQSGRTRSATLGGGRCATVPDEVLAMEKATRAVIRAVRAKVTTVRGSIDAYERELGRCEGLVVPRGRQADTEALLEAGSLIAVYAPVLAQLDGYVTALQNVQPEDPDLVRGVVSWRRFLTLVEAFPPVTADACPAVLEWAANSYAPESAPVDFADLRDALEAIGRQVRGITRASERLSKLGVFPNTLLGFDPYGLLRAAGVRVTG